MISEKLFEGLSSDEKRYWHSHKHEVESGMLKLGTKSLVPSESLFHTSRVKGSQVDVMHDMSERPAMIELHRTYGKTIHTWYVSLVTPWGLRPTSNKIRQYDKHPDLPLGPPQLMMSLTDDSMVEEHRDILEGMDKKVGASSQAKREMRAGYLPKENMDRPVAEGADSGLEQRLQFELKSQQ